MYPGEALIVGFDLTALPTIFLIGRDATDSRGNVISGIRY
jgi:hypothetical protein